MNPAEAAYVLRQWRSTVAPGHAGLGPAIDVAVTVLMAVGARVDRLERGCDVEQGRHTCGRADEFDGGDA